MKESYSKVIQSTKKILKLKFVNFYVLGLNLFCIFAGISYILIPFNLLLLDVFWNSFGIILILTFFGNIIYTYFISIKLNRGSKIGKRMKLFCTFYVFYINLSMGMMLFGNFLFGTSFQQGKANIGFWLLILGGYFGNLGLGICLSVFNIRNRNNRDLWSPSVNEVESSAKFLRLRKVTKWSTIIICVIILGFGIYMVYIMTIAPLQDFSAWLVAIFILPFALFFSFLILNATLYLLKKINLKKRPKLFYSIGILGVLLSTILLLPHISTPFVYHQTEQNFGTAFGNNWENEIDSNAKDMFLKTPFSLPAYFLGMPQKECIIETDTLFYDGEGIKLHYDAYYVEGDRSNLPGNSSVIISIHGGGWTGGSKGQGNLRFINSYFAAQGYVVFDIEYGLINEANLFQMTGTPSYVIGNFSIEDQLRHIGIFIKQLNSTEFQDRYNSLNLDSVFITGGSAGGHLTVASSLLISNGSYTGWFGSSVSIKGMMPLYPGDPPERYGNNTVLNPELYYVTENSPPCLMLQGEKDFCIFKTQQIKRSYSTASNDDCCVIYFPFQGHANDIYHTGHFNQFLLYYAERFLYLCTHDKIA